MKPQTAATDPAHLPREYNSRTVSTISSPGPTPIKDRRCNTSTQTQATVTNKIEVATIPLVPNK